MKKENVYSAIIERIFLSKFRKGMKEVEFGREEILETAEKLNVKVPKNLGDLVYSFRYRSNLPERIQNKAEKGYGWIIRPAGRAKYRFCLVPYRPLRPNENLVTTKIPDATPGIIAKYALTDEQALLAKLRYNRLVDIFTGVTCYSLQSHLRTAVPGIGQVETDEIYVGVDKKGIQYVFPVQAKGGGDRLSVVQIEQDIGVCSHKFPGLVSRPIGAQFMLSSVIALFEYELTDGRVSVTSEKHYRLVPPEEVTEEDLRAYRLRLSE